MEASRKVNEMRVVMIEEGEGRGNLVRLNVFIVDATC